MHRTDSEVVISAAGLHGLEGTLAAMAVVGAGVLALVAASIWWLVARSSAAKRLLAGSLLTAGVGALGIGMVATEDRWLAPEDADRLWWIWPLAGVVACLAPFLIPGGSRARGGR
ncbi:MAG: hypothetical protein HY901_01020 [Deltaproteobacteria bacterium]|nr:hypothetical protein [Deltaproteobacteria bacterium]